MSFVCPSWLSFILYNPLRKALTDRGRVLAESGILDGSVVLEVGAGNGFFTEAIAAHARKVYAVELQEGMILKLRKRVGRFGEKVVIVKGDIAVRNVGDSIADICLLYYSFHEVADKPAAAKNISRAIRPGGLLSIYEPTIEVGKAGMEKTIRTFTEVGFEKERVEHGLFTRFARLRKHKGTSRVPSGNGSIN